MHVGHKKISISETDFGISLAYSRLVSPRYFTVGIFVVAGDVVPAV